MKNWFDKHQVACLTYRHRWILMSDKLIRDYEFNKWMKEVENHHNELHKEF